MNNVETIKNCFNSFILCFQFLSKASKREEISLNSILSLSKSLGLCLERKDVFRLALIFPLLSISKDKAIFKGCRKRKKIKLEDQLKLEFEMALLEFFKHENAQEKLNDKNLEFQSLNSELLQEFEDVMEEDGVAKFIRCCRKKSDLVSWQCPAREAIYASPLCMVGKVQAFLTAQNIDSLYIHQGEALDAISRGENVIITTSTSR
jgi:hypothetical protein